MAGFSYKDGVLCAEEVPLPALAERHGTPAFVYSRGAIEANWRAYAAALAGRKALICYAVKANSNIAALNLLARLGSGFDIVSGGELERVLAAGGEPGKIVFSGVGKRRDELRRALRAGIKCFNIESETELSRLDAIAKEEGVVAPVSARVNPDIDPDTHPYIATGLRENKFGIEFEEALDLCRRAAALEGLRLAGIGCHIGSQVASVEPYAAALKKLLALAAELEGDGIAIEHIDLGGGLGISYQGEPAPAVEDLAAVVAELTPERFEIILEPGRSITGNAGVLLTRVECLKTNRGKHFAVVDAAMNDLLRPALYQAWHEIAPVVQGGAAPERLYDVVGPVCESGDFLGLQRRLALREGDLLAVFCAGAYGFSMSSNYNSRPRAVELLVDGGRDYIVRARESTAQLMAGEALLPERPPAPGAG